jgi:putative transposase
LQRICQLFGITRQSYYQYHWQAADSTIEHTMLINEVVQIRKRHPALGTRKLFVLLQPYLLEHNIKIGRDGLFNLLASHHLLVKRHKRRVSTTMSYHRFKKWPNLIKQFVPTAPNQLYVSDITYWKIATGYLYISFITDVFSHKIVGYNVAQNLTTLESIKALNMALKEIDKQEATTLIHHSDRGTQYCSNEYVNVLQDYDIKISMTENGDPKENAYAERINGIIKEEYLNFFSISTFESAKEILKEVIELYNSERPHMSISNNTPNFIHQTKITTNKLWKNYYPNKHKT